MHGDRPTSCDCSRDAWLVLPFTLFGLLCSVVPHSHSPPGGSTSCWCLPHWQVRRQWYSRLGQVQLSPSFACINAREFDFLCTCVFGHIPFDTDSLPILFLCIKTIYLCIHVPSLVFSVPLSLSRPVVHLSCFFSLFPLSPS